MSKKITQKILIASTLLSVAGLYGLALVPQAVSMEWGRPEMLPQQQCMPDDPDSSVVQLITLENVGHLKEVLEKHDYRFEDIMHRGDDVPRLFFTNFPKDIRKIKCVLTKKALFVQTLLPIILHVNEEIMTERKQLLILAKKVEARKALTLGEDRWLKELAEKYKMRRVDLGELKLRVDVIPPSLALGQAVIESGWGQSYAALKKNSPYGMTVSDQVKFYKSLHESTWSYARNLNSHRAYRKMRVTRAELRAQGKVPDGHTLIGDLIHYSEQKHEYIDKVRRAIAYNKLAHLDSGVQLSATVTIGNASAA